RCARRNGIGREERDSMPRPKAHAVAGALVLSAALAFAGMTGSPTFAAGSKDKTALPPKGQMVDPKGKSGTSIPPATTSFGIDTLAKRAFIIEADTDTVLFDKLADDRMPPASMSKIMTAYVVFDMLKQGRVKLSDELPVSERAWRLGGSKMFVP